MATIDPVKNSVILSEYRSRRETLSTVSAHAVRSGMTPSTGPV
jgi:hypothetical protein